MSAPPMSQKDANQVLRSAFDDASGTLRVDAIISPDGHDLEINNSDDSIAIGTTTALFTSTTVGSSIGLDVNIINSPENVTVSNFPATQAISAVALPLPTGASTSALQTTANTSLASIDSKLTSPIAISAASLPLPTGASTSSNQSTANTTLATIASNTTNAGTPTVSGTVSVNNFPATQPISAVSLPLPTGAATSANQSTANTTLNTINTTLGSPFQTGGSIGNTAFGISGTLPAFASTPTVNLGTISTAATAANQSTAITSLSTIVTNTTANIRTNILAAIDLVETFTWSDFGLSTQRISSIGYTSTTYAPHTLTKTYAYTLVGSSYELNTITWTNT